MKNIIDVMGIGAVVVDELLVLPAYPGPDEKVEIEAVVTQIGGPVPTALRILTRFGVMTSFAGKVGSDEQGGLICRTLEESGVDITHLIEETGRSSGFARIWIDKGKQTRAIAFSAGELSSYSQEDFAQSSLPSARLLHIDGREHDVIKSVISHYKAAGTLVSIDTGNYRERTRELLELADIIIMPHRFALSHFGDGNPNQLVEDCRKVYNRARAVFITKANSENSPKLN